MSQKNVYTFYNFMVNIDDGWQQAYYGREYACAMPLHNADDADHSDDVDDDGKVGSGNYFVMCVLNNICMREM